jgi:hypothetical protein
MIVYFPACAWPPKNQSINNYNCSACSSKYLYFFSFLKISLCIEKASLICVFYFLDKLAKNAINHRHLFPVSKGLIKSVVYEYLGKFEELSLLKSRVCRTGDRIVADCVEYKKRWWGALS